MQTSNHVSIFIVFLCWLMVMSPTRNKKTTTTGNIRSPRQPGDNRCGAIPVLHDVYQLPLGVSTFGTGDPGLGSSYGRYLAPRWIRGPLHAHPPAGENMNSSFAVCQYRLASSLIAGAVQHCAQQYSGLWNMFCSIKSTLTRVGIAR